MWEGDSVGKDFREWIDFFHHHADKGHVDMLTLYPEVKLKAELDLDRFAVSKSSVQMC